MQRHGCGMAGIPKGKERFAFWDTLMYRPSAAQPPHSIAAPPVGVTNLVTRRFRDNMVRWL